MNNSYIQERKAALNEQIERGVQMQQQGFQLREQGAKMVVEANGALAEIQLLEKSLDPQTEYIGDGTDTDT